MSNPGKQNKYIWETKDVDKNAEDDEDVDFKVKSICVKNDRLLLFLCYLVFL